MAIKQQDKEVYPMRLKDHARSAKKRKDFVQEPGLLMVGIDVSKAEHDACIGTQAGILSRKFEFTHSREGFRFFETTLRKKIFRHKCKRMLIAMEPSGIYWYALFERLKSSAYGVCLVNCRAVKNNRRTMQHGESKTDEKHAALRFLQANPTSRSIPRNCLTRFLEK